nr:LapA family protein [Catenovulum sediminis]
MAAILLLLSSYNTSTIEFNYLLAVQSMPLAVALAICLFVGIILASCAWFYYLFKLRYQLQKKNWKINKLNREIELLRLQLKDQ